MTVRELIETLMALPEEKWELPVTVPTRDGLDQGEVRTVRETVWRITSITISS